jgi:hypothetical protein
VLLVVYQGLLVDLVPLLCVLQVQVLQLVYYVLGVGTQALVVCVVPDEVELFLHDCVLQVLCCWGYIV